MSFLKASAALRQQMATNEDGNLSISMIILDSILNHIEDDQLVEGPIGLNRKWDCCFEEDAHVDLSLFYLVLEGPKYFHYRLH